jgi:two-component system, chemotaxis family, chemotaxis protein CheY
MARILAVDDSSSMRALLGATLTAAGHEVVSALDGEQALSLAQRQTMDLVITDIHMPKMDGVALVRELRRMDSYRLTPMLVLTTESGTGKKLEAKTAGATGWIAKPFDPKQLLEAVKKVLS